MNKVASIPNPNFSIARGRIEKALGPQPPVPIQLRDMTFVSVGVTFTREIVAAHLPLNLTPSEEGSGGFFAGLAREGHVLAPFATGHVWFDVLGHDGRSGPGRYLARVVSSAARSGDPAGGQIEPGQCCITESPGQTVAEVDRAAGPAFRIAVSQGRHWTANAGIDHAVAPSGLGLAATRLVITPWAADWCDAEPLQVAILSDDWADFAPTSLTWAAVGKSAAMTFGISAPLGPPKRP